MGFFDNLRQKQLLKKAEQWGLVQNVLYFKYEYQWIAPEKLATTYIEPFENGTAKVGDATEFVRRLAIQRANQAVYRKNPNFKSLLIWFLEENCDGSEFKNLFVENICVHFQYPTKLLFSDTIQRLLVGYDNEKPDYPKKCLGAALNASDHWKYEHQHGEWKEDQCRIWHWIFDEIALLSNAEKLKVKTIVINAAKSSPFATHFIFCWANGWLTDLEALWRKENRFEDVLKLLLFQNRTEETMDWLKQNDRYDECSRFFDVTPRAYKERIWESLFDWLLVKRQVKPITRLSHSFRLESAENQKLGSQKLAKTWDALFELCQQEADYSECKQLILWLPSAEVKARWEGVVDWLMQHGQAECVFELFTSLPADITASKWNAMFQWLTEKCAFCECAQLLAMQRRFKEAADLVEKVGPDHYYAVSPGNVNKNLSCEECLRHYHEEVGRLRSAAAALELAGKISPATMRKTDDLEEKYLYGEIPKEEYERLKAKAAPAPTKTCGACGKSVNPEHAFCPHCGAKS